IGKADEHDERRVDGGELADPNGRERADDAPLARDRLLKGEVAQHERVHLRQRASHRVLLGVGAGAARRHESTPHLSGSSRVVRTADNLSAMPATSRVRFFLFLAVLTLVAADAFAQHEKGRPTPSDAAKKCGSAIHWRDDLASAFKE